MIKITIIAVGKLKEKFFIEAADEYIKRLSRFCKLNIIEIEPNKLPDNPDAATVDSALKCEGEKILSKIPAGAYVYALCVEGKMIDSVALSHAICDDAAFGKGEQCFIIGGSCGLSNEVKMRADMRLSVSPMTFPHKLFRVMLLEQIYRAFMIESGGTYHK